MANDAEELDSQLAERLRHAADGDPVSTTRLPDAARARVLEAVLRESARLVRQRRRRAWAASAGVVVALAACAALAMMPRREQGQETHSQIAQTSAAACGLPTAADSLQIASGAGRKRISLGRLGELAAEADADLHIVSSSACELTISLRRGMLAADLHNLRPARLRIATDLGNVEVRGTTFSVHVDPRDRSLEVVLLHGAVDVVSERHTEHLTPGHTLRRHARAAAARIEPSTEPARVAVQALIASAPATPTDAAAAMGPSLDDSRVAPEAEDAGMQGASRKALSERSATELLARAERERRAGAFDAARALYREAGALRGADAEVALLRWARLELSAHAPQASRDVLTRYHQRFLRGRLRAEAGWLELRALEELGQKAEAKAVARKLIATYPDSPHAQAAQRVLSTP